MSRTPTISTETPRKFDNFVDRTTNNQQPTQETQTHEHSNHHHRGAEKV